MTTKESYLAAQIPPPLGRLGGAPSPLGKVGRAGLLLFLSLSLREMLRRTGSFTSFLF